MQQIMRFTLSLVIALSTCLGAFALVGCGGSSAESSAASASEQAASTEAADTSSSASSDEADGEEEQDNCYGDDLPAVKK